MGVLPDHFGLKTEQPLFFVFSVIATMRDTTSTHELDNGKNSLKQHLTFLLTKHQWRCPHCKTCELCVESGNEDELFMCDECDRGYHTFCLSPPLAEVPSERWVCPDCGSTGNTSNIAPVGDDSGGFASQKELRERQGTPPSPPTPPTRPVTPDIPSQDPTTPLSLPSPVHISSAANPPKGPRQKKDKSISNGSLSVRSPVATTPPIGTPPMTDSPLSSADKGGQDYVRSLCHMVATHLTIGQTADVDMRKCILCNGKGDFY